MSLRIEYREVAPEAVSALAGLNQYLDRTAIDERLRRLLEVRTSQINGCSYCVHIHRRQALALGETEERLQALEGWRTSGFFDERERSALAWAEDVTLLPQTHAPDDTYQALREHFDDRQLVDLTMVIISMNAWNRLAVSFGRKAPGTG